MPIDPVTLLPVVGNLLSGLFGKKKAKKEAAQQRAWALEDQAEYFTRTRAAAEKAGFNPLAVLGMLPQTNPVQMDSANYMGNAIADSAMLLADDLASKAQQAVQAKNQQLQVENKRLQAKVTKAIVRPKIGGVYSSAGHFGTGGYVASRQSTAGSVSVPDHGRVSDVGADDPLLTVHPGDPRREVQNLPVTTDPGFSDIDNPTVGRFSIPTFNGEIIDITQVPTVLGAYLWDKSKDALARSRAAHDAAQEKFRERRKWSRGHAAHPKKRFWDAMEWPSSVAPTFSQF